MKPLLRRARADEDVLDAVSYYLEHSPAAALRFVDALERAYGHIERHPAAGVPRYVLELNLPGLRYWALRRFPYFVFYVEHDDHTEVWRVLHARRDIPAWMQPDGGSPS